MNLTANLIKISVIDNKISGLFQNPFPLAHDFRFTSGAIHYGGGLGFAIFTFQKEIHHVVVGF